MGGAGEIRCRREVRGRDDVPTAGLNDGCSWLRQRFQSNEEPLTERVGAKGEKTVLLTADVLASGWLNLIDDSYGR